MLFHSKKDVIFPGLYLKPGFYPNFYGILRYTVLVGLVYTNSCLLKVKATVLLLNCLPYRCHVIHPQHVVQRSTSSVI